MDDNLQVQLQYSRQSYETITAEYPLLSIWEHNFYLFFSKASGLKNNDYMHRGKGLDGSENNDFG